MAIYTLSRSVNFGPAKSGLVGTVGYRVLNYDGTVQVARTTSGIVEAPSGSGIYAAPIALTVGVDALLLWDSGGGAPVYASDDCFGFWGQLAAGTLTLGPSGLDAINVDGVNLRQVMALVAAALAGKCTITGSTIVYRGVDGTSSRITASGDAQGQRLTVTLTPPP